MMKLADYSLSLSRRCHHVISAFWTQHVNVGLVLALLISGTLPSSEYECEQEHWQDAIIERIYTSSIELSNTITAPMYKYKACMWYQILCAKPDDITMSLYQ